MVRIKWDIRDTESPRTVRGGGSVEVADRIVNFDNGIRNHGAGWIHHGAANGRGVGLSIRIKPNCQTENHHKSRVKRPLVRSQHEFLQKVGPKIKGNGSWDTNLHRRLQFDLDRK